MEKEPYTYFEIQRILGLTFPSLNEDAIHMLATYILWLSPSQLGELAEIIKIISRGK